MSSQVKPIPEGYHSVTPYMMVEGADQLIEFLKRAFGATEALRLAGPDGKVGHAEIRVGDSMLMVSEARGEWKAKPASFYLYVEDVDAVYRRALDAGGTSLGEVKDQFYGDRSGGVLDPCGNMWWVATHIEDMSGEELERRHTAARA